MMNMKLWIRGCAAVLAASVTACTIEVEPPAHEAHVGDSEPRAAVTNDAVLAMAQDPAFGVWIVGLSQHAKLMLNHMVVPAYLEHGPGAGEHLFHRWANYRDAVESLGLDPNDVSLADAPTFQAATGLPLTAVATTIAQADALDEQYGLLSMTRPQIELAVDIAVSDLAIANQISEGWSDPSVVIGLGAQEVDPCVAECAERTADSWIVASATIYILADIFADLGLDLVFIVAEGALVAVSASALSACIEECGASDNTCSSDEDCDTKEYCDKGWLTIGKNQCVFSRDEGEICTRSAQCKSGCCKYHAFSNLISPVCRPSDKCS